MIRFKVTPISVSVHYETDNPLFGESATIISIDDEGAGGFFVMEQNGEELKNGQVKFDNDELALVASEGDKLMRAYDKACRRADAATKKEEPHVP